MDLASKTDKCLRPFLPPPFSLVNQPLIAFGYWVQYKALERGDFGFVLYALEGVKAGLFKYIALPTTITGGSAIFNNITLALHSNRAGGSVRI